MKKILVLYFSNSGQTQSIVNNLIKPLQQNSQLSVHIEKLLPNKKYPFPWSLFSFFNEMPDAVCETGCNLKDLSFSPEEKFDLILLCYPIWFLSISTPMMGFLKSTYSKTLKDSEVITIVSCRNMWIAAQERMKYHLAHLNAKFVGNILFRDRSGNNPITFLSTPLWLLTGKKSLFSFIPEAGIDPNLVTNSDGYGKTILDYLGLETKNQSNSLFNIQQGEGIAFLGSTERLGKQIFKVWANLITFLTQRESFLRKILIVLFLFSLLFNIVFILPIWFIIFKIFQVITNDSKTCDVIQFSVPFKVQIGGD